MMHLPPIRFEAIPHKQHRYETVGDYYKVNKEWLFKVSKTNADYEFLVLIHELVEWYLTQRKGIKESDISKFDKMFEQERAEGLWDLDEPGNDPRAPYRDEHIFAESIERTIAKYLKLDWKLYDKTINGL